jgi:hypothetical protein
MRFHVGERSPWEDAVVGQGLHDAVEGTLIRTSRPATEG